MPPIYDWVCVKCRCEVSLLRSFDDYRKAPTAAEVPGTDTCPEHDWDKRINAPKTVYGSGWGPNGGSGKGSW